MSVAHPILQTEIMGAASRRQSQVDRKTSPSHQCHCRNRFDIPGRRAEGDDDLPCLTYARKADVRRQSPDDFNEVAFLGQEQSRPLLLDRGHCGRTLVKLEGFCFAIAEVKRDCIVQSTNRITDKRFGRRLQIPTKGLNRFYNRHPGGDLRMIGSHPLSHEE